MFCFQCQECAQNKGCTIKGVCGKPEVTANLQDLLIHTLKGIALWSEKAVELGVCDKADGLFVAQGLFTTITNANWDDKRFVGLIREALGRREEIRGRVLAAFKAQTGKEFGEPMPDAATWMATGEAEFHEKAISVGVMATENEDVRSLRELLVIGLKGIAAYADHAAVLGYEDEDIYDFIMEALASTTKDLSVDEMVALVMKAGETAVTDHGPSGQGQHHHLRQSGDHRSQHRRAQQSRHPDLRP